MHEPKKGSCFYLTTIIKNVIINDIQLIGNSYILIML